MKSLDASEGGRPVHTTSSAVSTLAVTIHTSVHISDSLHLQTPNSSGFKTQINQMHMCEANKTGNEEKWLLRLRPLRSDWGQSTSLVPGRGLGRHLEQPKRQLDPRVSKPWSNMVRVTGTLSQLKKKKNWHGATVPGELDHPRCAVLVDTAGNQMNLVKEVEVSGGLSSLSADTIL